MDQGARQVQKEAKGNSLTFNSWKHLFIHCIFILNSSVFKMYISDTMCHMPSLKTWHYAKAHNKDNKPHGKNRIGFDYAKPNHQALCSIYSKCFVRLLKFFFFYVRQLTSVIFTTIEFIS